MCTVNNEFRNLIDTYYDLETQRLRPLPSAGSYRGITGDAVLACSARSDLSVGS